MLYRIMLYINRVLKAIFNIKQNEKYDDCFEYIFVSNENLNIIVKESLVKISILIDELSIDSSEYFNAIEHLERGTLGRFKLIDVYDIDKKRGMIGSILIEKKRSSLETKEDFKYYLKTGKQARTHYKDYTMLNVKKHKEIIKSYVQCLKLIKGKEKHMAIKEYNEAKEFKDGEIEKLKR